MNEISRRILLGVNIDHVATLRQARGTNYPSPFSAGMIAADAGAAVITVHLREDRRHIQDHDVEKLRELLTIPLNLEMAATPEMVAYAIRILPTEVCLVPERRAELTTEGGLDVAGNFGAIHDAVKQLTAAGICVALFVDPDERQIYAAKQVSAPVIEVHTGHYADAVLEFERNREYQRIIQAVNYAQELGLKIHAGHGLNYENVSAIAAIPEIVELNIGHAIIARAIIVGLSAAIREMIDLMHQARANLFATGK